MEVLVGVEERIAFIMLVFKYSVAVSMSSFVFSETEAEWLKTSLTSCQLVSWLWIVEVVTTSTKTLHLVFLIFSGAAAVDSI